MDINVLMLSIVVGFANGMATFLIASGLSLTFGVMRIINFGHGTFWELAVYLSFSLMGLFAFSSNSFWLVLLIAPVIVAILGGIAEVAFLRPIYLQHGLYHVLVTFGIAMIVAELVKMTWGTNIIAISGPRLPVKSVSVLGQNFPAYYLFVVVVSGLVGLGLWFLLVRTRLGVLVRAAIDDRDIASAMGVGVDWMFTGMFMLGIWLAGLGGVLMGPMIGISPGMGISILFNCFVVVIIGGMGSLVGSLVGSLILGLVLSIGNVLMPTFYVLLPFMLMVVTLIARPQGLFGAPEV